MYEKEKDVIKRIADALPSMSDFDKGYLLGIAEANAKEEKQNNEDECDGSSETP